MVKLGRLSIINVYLYSINKQKKLIMENYILFTDLTKNYLINRKIIEVGKNYIKLDNGLHIYLDNSEIEHLNNLNESE